MNIFNTEKMEMKAYCYLQIEINGSVAILWLNRPEKHNALNPVMMQEVIHFFETIEGDDSVRVVLIKGRGKSFCAGADLQWLYNSSDLTSEDNLDEARLLSAFFATVFHSSKVTVGVAHGNVFGGGNGLLAACDLAYAIDNSCFSLSETRIGMIAASISPYMLQKLSVLVYKELVFTARRFDAIEAVQMGLLNASFETVKEMNEHIQLVIRLLLEAGPHALAGSKRLINNLLDPGEASMAIKEIPELLAAVRVSNEAREGFSAFLEKRKPDWIMKIKEG